MIKANDKDKELIIDILAKSFVTNKSVNYLIKLGKNKLSRIRYLMSYAFEVCYLSGEVLLSEDQKACALLIYPDSKKPTLKSVWLDIKLIFFCIGLQNIRKILKREALIKKLQPKERMTYLWFIGVHPEYQNQGIGSALLNELITHNTLKNQPIYLETSTLKNLPWYQKLGFTIYHELDLGYTLYFLKR